MSRLTFVGRNRFPVWSPDGTRIAFQSDRDGDLAVFSQRVDGSGAVERLTKPDRETAHTPETWSPSGHLLFTETKGRAITLWSLTIASKRVEPFGKVHSFAPTSAAFSPDGRSVAYGTTEEDRPFSIVFVRPFPATGATYQISRDDDGHHPIWSRDRHELLYVPGPGRVTGVTVTTQPAFSVSPPFEVPPASVMGPPTVLRNHDLARDGSLVGFIAAADSPSVVGASTIHVVLNWFEELKARVPIK